MKTLANNEKEAWEMIDKLDVCANCIHFNVKNLFESVCMPHFENSHEFNVSHDSKCECFQAKDKQVEYHINKLVEMALEFNGQNDFMRQLRYHEENGTEDEFLGLTQIRDKKK